MWDQESATRLGTSVRRFRTERGLSQESLAFQAGITKNQLQLIEFGKGSGATDRPGPSNPKMSTLSGIARILNITVAELLADAGL
ncbi:transcriptional regulator with XRE-family HTH domain [Microbacterium sp. BE35]|uniref:helix-turn-helix domain-containing protein n=1 Tax=Microbacterium sp. BE35 TaxID=2817773 RepID=UPI002856CAE5|nr:helix-turn-helix transcriptional regulator [Microbacterium sp. BE35]MDR7188118.1 transcriptional regulator with XRE-family HTH domain [Microbacterium sp. BE35]